MRVVSAQCVSSSPYKQVQVYGVRVCVCGRAREVGLTERRCAKSHRRGGGRAAHCGPAAPQPFRGRRLGAFAAVAFAAVACLPAGRLPTPSLRVGLRMAQDTPK